MKKSLLVLFLVGGLSLSSVAGAWGAENAGMVSDMPDITVKLRAEQAFMKNLGVLNPSDGQSLGGFDELVPYVLASPDQEDAGSCLYMSLTGVAEWWLTRLHPELPRTPDGPTDLSERYFMNLGGKVSNWRTDAILRYNKNQKRSVLNAAFPFLKGWYTGAVSDDDVMPAAPFSPGAEYGVYLNWYDENESVTSGWVALPEFARKVIFQDKDKDQWAMGVAPDDIDEQVKQALVTRKAPVQVIYNHTGYWHSVYVIGFNDDMNNGNCAFTQYTIHDLKEEISGLEEEIAAAPTPERRAKLERRLASLEGRLEQVEDLYDGGRGCRSSRGVFYIRDSIYPDESGPVYDYDPRNLGPKPDEAPYSKKIVVKEYDWLKFFGNHVTIIYTQ